MPPLVIQGEAVGGPAVTVVLFGLVCLFSSSLFLSLPTFPTCTLSLLLKKRFQTAYQLKRTPVLRVQVG